MSESMSEKLQKLYRTMLLVETKGENTKIMADCLRYVESLVKEAGSASNAETK